MSRVVLKNISKTYKNKIEAVKNLTIEIQDGEFMCLLGPSGCGKSTTMRMIAGLEDITNGDMYIDDVRVNELRPMDRDVAMAFENYALYPHMTIEENIAFPLVIRKYDKTEINKKVKEVSSLLGIDSLLNESVKGISGGVQQRVGVARALVRNPKVLILDEPISHLEEELKAKMREELRKLQRKLAVTTLYVTHDQIEAMVMADRIAIMNYGVLQQVDTPDRIYHNPANVFSGGFIGEPPMNFIVCSLSEAPVYSLEFGGVFMQCPDKIYQGLKGKNINKVILGVRDTQVLISNIEKEKYVQGMVYFIEPRNEEQLVNIELGGEKLLVTTSIKNKLTIGKPVWMQFDFDRCCFFDLKTEKNLFLGE